MALLAYRDLIWCLVQRDLKVRYRRSALGLLWTVLQPLLAMLVLQAVFSTIFRFALENYAVYALSGLLLWNFFHQSVVTSMNSLRGNAQIIRKVPLPREVFPIATVLAGVVNMLLALVPLFAIVLATGHPLRPAVLFLPVAIVLAALFTLGVGFLVSPLAVFFYDVVEVAGVVLSLLLYLTPVFYPMEIVPERFRWVIALNPLRAILEVFREPIYRGRLPSLPAVLVASLVAILSLGVGAISFRRKTDRIPFYL